MVFLGPTCLPFRPMDICNNSAPHCFASSAWKAKSRRLQLGSRPVRLEALPIGIAPEEYTDLLKSDRTTADQYAEWIRATADER